VEARLFDDAFPISWSGSVQFELAPPRGTLCLVGEHIGSLEEVQLSAQSDIDRIRKSIQDLQRKIGQESGKVAAARQKAARAGQSAQRSKSQTTISSKMREAQREEDRAIKAESDRAKLEGKLADEQKKLHAAEGKLAKEQERARQRSMDQLRSSIERSQTQFRPTFSAPKAPSPDLKSTSEYDVFISHASEDKGEIATPLAEKLRDRGLRVWFDAFELQIGDSLRRKIDEGLASSTFGVVILSQHFFAKEWPQVELDGLSAKAASSDQPMILPIWHHISKEEVLAKSPTLAGVVALNTALMTIDEIVEALIRRVEASAE
jgi:hypothetical protein